MIQPEAIDADADLERRIDYQATLMCDQSMPMADRLSACEELKRLHAMRSPEVVAAMEEAMGIR